MAYVWENNIFYDFIDKINVNKKKIFSPTCKVYGVFICV